MNLTFIAALLGSGVIAAIVTAVFSKMTSDKNVRIENITEERAKWCETMLLTRAGLESGFRGR